MKYIVFVLLIFIISCSSTKLLKGVDSKNDNIFVEICLLENSKGLTIDKYFEAAEFNENEMITNFFSDEKYMSSMNELMKSLKDNSSADNSREEMNELMKSASVDYPTCISVFPMFVSVARNTMN